MPGNFADEELENFAELARKGLLESDPAPPEIAELAKLAFQFRDTTTIDSIDTPENDREFAEVRGATSELEGRASDGETAIAWKVSGDHLVGVIDPATDRTIELQSLTAQVSVEVSELDGSFHIARIDGAYRFVVHGPGGTWATSWTTSH